MKGALNDKSFEFAKSIIRLCDEMIDTRKEYTLSRQLMRSGTAVGALYREAYHAESRADFIHKLAISQKECNETIYWLDLLHSCGRIPTHTYQFMRSEAVELMRIITSIILTAKRKREHK